MHLLRHPDTSFTCRLKLQEALIKKLAVVHSLFYVFRITLNLSLYKIQFITTYQYHGTQKSEKSQFNTNII